VAIARDALLQITDSNGKTWGLHPACEGLQTLFNDDNLSFVSGVGPLWEPTTKLDVTRNRDSTVRLPRELRAHNTQQEQWRQGHPDMRQKSGWGALTGDHVDALNNAIVPMSPNISTAGPAQFTSGARAGFGLALNGMPPLVGFLDSERGVAGTIRKRALEELLNREYASPFINATTASTRNYEALFAQVNAAMENASASVTTEFPTTSLGRQLQRIMMMIGASRNELGYKRQVFYARIGGWDTHSNQMEQRQPVLLGDVASSMLAFRNALREINADHQVTTFTQSEFGRTLTSNGSGSDHAWAGVQWVMGKAQSQGGSLVPRRIFGDYPILDLNDSPLIFNRRGNVIPTVSTQAYGATFSRWMGVSQNDLGVIFPNLDRFDMQDVGFLG